MAWLEFISTAGLGGLIVIVLQSWLTNKSATRNRNFQEKKEAYIGFLSSVTEADITPSRETAIRSGHWISICELMGSNEVRGLLGQYLETNPIDGETHPDRPAVMKRLKDEMRKDLGVAL
ncbi:MAG: hypothetical protein NUV50_09695 [Rhodospirillales bacterium]|nr:hypothetical protein [Rhodospirillales bacterium]